MSGVLSGARAQRLLCCLAVGLSVTATDSTAAQSKPWTSFYNKLTPAEVSLAWETVQKTLETRISTETGRWQNDLTGHSGSVTPIRTYRIKAGTYCRDYRETVVHIDRAVARIATACRNGDGVWVMVER